MSPPYVLYDMQTGMVAVGPDGERWEFLDVPAGHKIAVINATTNTRISGEIVRPDEGFVWQPSPRKDRSPAEEDADWPVAAPQTAPPAARAVEPPSNSVIQVGPNRRHATLRSALAVAEDGEIIEIDGGNYTEDNALVIDKQITLRGVSEPRPTLFRTTLITRADVTVENLHFEGCSGAAIRSESGKLLVYGCLFKDNQSGLRGDDSTESAIFVSDSEFNHNNVVDISAGAIKELVVGGCRLHDAGIGPQIKSRAAKTNLVGCTVDGHVDLPDESSIVHCTINGTVYP